MMIVILLAKCDLVRGHPGIPGGAIASFAALATMAGLPAGVMGRLYQHQYPMRYGRYLRERYWRYGRLRGAEREN
mgnify:CR=1 FL=1